jgi:hypothetical protein
MSKVIVIRSILILIITIPFIWVIGCEDSSGPNSGIEFPDVNVSYNSHVQPLFNQSCAISLCHNDQSMASNLSLTSYLNATARPGIIIPFDAPNSILIQRIEGSLMPQMPLNRPRLTPNQINGLRQWIEEGAQNN